MREVVKTDKAPGAVGPYSQAIKAAGMVWVSGQIALVPESGRMLEADIEAETEQVMNNLRAVLEAAGSGLSKVIKATIYLTDLGNFEKVNGVYGSYFTDAPPARACVEVSRLPKDANVEIEAVAELS
jgi:2-iminobutanoate/2-iminopropanoate deaminase